MLAGFPRWARIGIALAFVVALLVVQGIAFALVVGAAWLLGVRDMPALDAASTAVFAALSVVELLTLGALFAFVALMPTTLRALGWDSDPRAVLRGLLATLPVLLLFVAGPLAVLVATQEDVVATGMTADRALVIVTFALLVGLTEELAFRGVLVELLGGRAAPLLALFGSAVLFALGHVPFGESIADSTGEWGNALAVGLAVGIPFAAIRLRGGSLVALALAHGLIDVFGLLHIGRLELPDTSNTEALQQLALAVALGAGYLVWFFRTGGARADPALPAGTIVD